MRFCTILLAGVLLVPTHLLALSEIVRAPEHLTKMLADYDREIKAGRPVDRAQMDSIDLAAGQKDAVYSRVFWYTDLEQAKSEAVRQGKPVLSLRMLGKLDEEMSCANSRFFRTVLYSNESISKIMRDNYVLHWQSVRDVPMMTIKFADGRKIERPITGNSMHMILRADGSVVDVLSGMNSPERFRTWLNEGVSLAAAPAAKPALQMPVTVLPVRPDAAVAGRIAVSKGFVETRPLRELGFAFAASPTFQPGGEEMFDESSKRLICAKAGLTSGSPEAKYMLGELAGTITMDTNLNLSVRQNIMRVVEQNRRLDDWALTERIYAEAFAMPLDDPWAGLNPPGTYSALPHNGLSEPGKVSARD